MVQIRKRFKCDMLSMGPEFRHLYMLTRPVGGKRHAVAVGLIAKSTDGGIVADRGKVELGLSMIKWVGLAQKEAMAPLIVFTAHPRANLYCRLDSSDGLGLDGDTFTIPPGMFSKF